MVIFSICWSIYYCFGFEFLDVSFCHDWTFIVNGFLSCISFETNISTSSINFDFSLPLIFFLIASKGIEVEIVCKVLCQIFFGFV